MYQNINRNANPQFHTDSSDAEDDNYEQPCHEDSENRGEEEEEEEKEEEEEEEEEEENPLPIPGPSSTCLTTQELEKLSNEQSSESTNYGLGNNNRGNIPSENKEFPPLLDSDVCSYADPDLEANKKKKCSYVRMEEGGNDEEENIDELQEIGYYPAGESQ